MKPSEGNVEDGYTSKGVGVTTKSERENRRKEEERETFTSFAIILSVL